MKTCNKCNIEKPFKAFHKGKGYKDGYWATCIDCVRERNRAYKAKRQGDTSAKVETPPQVNCAPLLLPVAVEAKRCKCPKEVINGIPYRWHQYDCLFGGEDANWPRQKSNEIAYQGMKYGY